MLVTTEISGHESSTLLKEIAYSATQKLKQVPPLSTDEGSQ